jgi:hypothetical protein
MVAGGRPAVFFLACVQVGEACSKRVQIRWFAKQIVYFQINACMYLLIILANHFDR